MSKTWKNLLSNLYILLLIAGILVTSLPAGSVRNFSTPVKSEKKQDHASEEQSFIIKPSIEAIVPLLHPDLFKDIVIWPPLPPLLILFEQVEASYTVLYKNKYLKTLLLFIKGPNAP